MQRILQLIYPKSIHPSYNEFVIWSSISTLIGSSQGAIATHSMLSAIGDDYQLRSTNYIGKDVIGQTLGLFGASIFTHYGKVDTKPTKHATVSVLLQQSSYLMFCATPLISPDYFLAIAGCSNALMNISFLGIGAVNAKCIQAMSTKDNIAELYSKITIVNTLVASIGMTAGVAISNYMSPEEQVAVLTAMGPIRMYALNRSIKCVLNNKSLSPCWD